MAVVDLVTSCCFKQGVPLIQETVDLFLHGIEKCMPYIRNVYIYLDGDGTRPEVRYCVGKVLFMHFPMSRRIHGWNLFFPYQTAADSTDADCLIACHIDIYLQEDPIPTIDKVLNEGFVAASDVIDLDEPRNFPKPWLYFPQPSSDWIVINVKKWSELSLCFSDRENLLRYPQLAEVFWKGSIYGFDRGNIACLILHLHSIGERWWFCHTSHRHYVRWFFVLNIVTSLYCPMGYDSERCDCIYRPGDHLGSLQGFQEQYIHVFGKAPSHVSVDSFLKRYNEMNASIIPPGSKVTTNQNDTENVSVQPKIATDDKKKCFIFATAGLGEVVVETAVMKEFYKRGYDVYLFIQKPIEPAFRLLPYLKEVIPLDSDRDFRFSQPGDKIELSSLAIEEVKKRINLNDNVSFVSFNGVPNTNTVLALNTNNFSISYYGAFNQFENYNRTTPPSSHDYFASRAGINLSECTIDIAFPNEEVPLLQNGKKNVGIGIGTGGLKTRRIHSNTLALLVKELSSDYNIYVFGLGCDKEALGKLDCIDASSSEKTSETIVTSLNYLKHMNIFITPDSGFMHCSLAMGIPVIFLQSTAIPELTIHPNFYHLVTRYKPSTLTCDKNCMACFHDEFLPERSKPDASWTGKLDEERWRQSSHAPHDLSCYQEQEESVQCMTAIDPSEIKRIVNSVI